MHKYGSLVFVLIALIAVVNCRPQGEFFAPRIIPILSRSHQIDPYGQFSLSYRSGDGTNFNEQGHLKLTDDRRDHVLVKKGSYSYLSPDGRTIQVSYTADENGFHPVSPIIPVPVAPLQ